MRMKRAIFGLIAAFATPLEISGPASAAVLIKTNRVTLCVTDTKHPDACKKIAADGSSVVSEDALEALNGELGQGASIMEANGGPKPPGGHGGRHRHGDQDQAEPPAQ